MTCKAENHLNICPNTHTCRNGWCAHLYVLKSELFFKQSSSLSLLLLACNYRVAGFLCLLLRMRVFLVSAVCEPVFSTPQEGRWMALIYSSGRGETGPTGDYRKQMDAPRRTECGHRAERRDIEQFSLFWLFPLLLFLSGCYCVFQHCHMAWEGSPSTYS